MEGLHDVGRYDPHVRLVPLDPQRAPPWRAPARIAPPAPGHRDDLAPDPLGRILPVPPLSLAVMGHVLLERDQHGDHLFLVHLQPAANEVASAARTHSGHMSEVVNMV